MAELGGRDYYAGPGVPEPTKDNIVDLKGGRNVSSREQGNGVTSSASRSLESERLTRLEVNRVYMFFVMDASIRGIAPDRDPHQTKGPILDQVIQARRGRVMHCYEKGDDTIYVIEIEQRVPFPKGSFSITVDLPGKYLESGQVLAADLLKSVKRS
ncbi:MAG: hypothetical protein UT55_C0088G0001 [Candidatus Peregrinibacteria bacterium GW2011_GWE2_39_6]|nr:MAG: hypothetical protein UT36_C0011G0001 [Candidatus Peregrinibacteria bacterium GW2011_GWF2_39_17]KKR23576.1 MAG: hypothetical protein UT55_C0088G0001 [Candidatus Peregrinibacteria bacterium GW2011_GWE2_39_6]